jgi:hypothetical protein
MEHRLTSRCDSWDIAAGIGVVWRGWGAVGDLPTQLFPRNKCDKYKDGIVHSLGTDVVSSDDNNQTECVKNCIPSTLLLDRGERAS